MHRSRSLTRPPVAWDAPTRPGPLQLLANRTRSNPVTARAVQLLANRAGRKKARIDESLPEEEQIYQSQGLVSIDRSEAAALLSTTPRLRRRSSTDDLAPLHRMGWILLRHPGPRSRAGRLSFAVASPSRAPNPVDPRLSLPPDAGAQQYRYIFGRDSDLEAFSHNPPDGSFAPLPYQAST